MKIEGAKEPGNNTFTHTTSISNTSHKVAITFCKDFNCSRKRETKKENKQSDDRKPNKEASTNKKLGPRNTYWKDKEKKTTAN